jgi:prepilin-type N-terminal cleavage/methylation domain-containing protein
MNVQQKNKEKGFTIIEVVLVLAIAGLIFLMVFIALPSLQRGQRDAQRKTDLSRALTKISDYQSNNRNSLPSDWGDFSDKYLKVGNDTFVDPSGTDYAFIAKTGSGSEVTGEFKDEQGKVYYTIGTTCGDDGKVTAAGGRKVSLRMKLEGGGVACSSN